MSIQHRRPDGRSSIVLGIAAWLATVGIMPGEGIEGAEPTLEVVSVRKIWDAGNHNAFTDLIRWHDQYWIVFREADGHVGGDGKIRVLTSSDGDRWESAALVAETGIDLRDPKLSVTPDDRMMLVCGGSVYEGKKLLGRRPRTVFSADGREWTKPYKVLSEREWLWRVTWHEGMCYGVTYNASMRGTPEAQEAAKSSSPATPGAAEWKSELVRSRDGIEFENVAYLDVPGHPNETTLRFLHNGTLMALVRREGGSHNAWIGTSRAPYVDWTWHETAMRVGGPNFIELPDGKLWAVVRNYVPTAKTWLAKMDDHSLTPELELPSGGDTSYAGMLWHDDLLWISYYSSHEGKTSIYLAKVRL